jgi:hypothetical protein
MLVNVGNKPALQRDDLIGKSLRFLYRIVSSLLINPGLAVPADSSSPPVA